MASPLDISHGRGGAGNINPDDTPYADGEMVRVADGPGGSSGRGGAGNISDGPATMRAGRDVVPAAATRPPSEGATVGGRGGRGNVEPGTAAGGGAEKEETDKERRKAVKATEATEATPVGLADKLKGKIFELFQKKK